MNKPIASLRHILFVFAGGFLGILLTSQVVGQSNERWFQIEVSVFSNENAADRESEVWTPSVQPLTYPTSMQRLQNLKDLLVIDDLLGGNPAEFNALLTADQPTGQTLEQYVLATGPFPAKPATDFRFFDFDRDAFVQLPASASNFQQTNRALERSADHRLLYHGLWRQPVFTAANATPLYVTGGSRYGDFHELQGSITIRFNANADRVVIDADLWLSEFSIVADTNNNWALPPIPARVRRSYELAADSVIPGSSDYHIRRIYRFQQSRDMRSTEFHYLDHPAMGVIIMVEPYTVPPLPTPGSEPELLQ